jgi:ankyrin repeat protein
LIDDSSFEVPNIFYAVDISLPRVAEELLKAGEDVNAIGPGGDPLLVITILRHDEAMVKLLLAHGADINSAGSSRTSIHALFWAAALGSPLTKLLVDHGTNVNAVSNRGTALSAACEWGHQWVVEFLLKRGAQVDIVDTYGSSALSMASAYGHKEIVKLLIAKGTDVNIESVRNKPLCGAARNGYTEIVAMLIEAGANINADESGALFYALCGGHECTVAVLEATDADKLTLRQLNKALIRVCHNKHFRFRERAVEMLLDRGADVNAGEGTALLGALRTGDQDFVALLEAKGAKRPTSKQLDDALIQVRKYPWNENRESAVQMLLDRGAQPAAADSEDFSNSETSSTA